MDKSLCTINIQFYFMGGNVALWSINLNFPIEQNSAANMYQYYIKKFTNKLYYIVILAL